jgi:hypothetical protein
MKGSSFFLVEESETFDETETGLQMEPTTEGT